MKHYTIIFLVEKNIIEPVFIKTTDRNWFIVKTSKTATVLFIYHTQKKILSQNDMHLQQTNGVYKEEIRLKQK